jgi:hypothetical protein
MTPQEGLEQLVSQHGLKGVLTMLAAICGERAERTAVKWQDTVAAKEWAKYADAMENAVLDLWG